MSVEAVKVFMANLVTDQNLFERTKKSKNIDDRIALKHAAEYDFTAGEFRKCCLWLCGT